MVGENDTPKPATVKDDNQEVDYGDGKSRSDEQMAENHPGKGRSRPGENWTSRTYTPQTERKI